MSVRNTRSKRSLPPPQKPHYIVNTPLLCVIQHFTLILPDLSFFVDVTGHYHCQLKEEEESDDDDEAAPILANSVKTMQKEKTSFSSKTGYDAFLSSRVGDFGRWQMCVFLVVSPVIMANAFINVGQTFLFYEQAFRCEVSPCDDPSLASSSPVYDSYFAPYAIPFWEDRDDLDDEDDITAKSCTFFRYNGSDALEEGGICKEEDFAKSLEDTGASFNC